VIKKLFGTFAAKVAVVALAGGFATGGLVAAGAFTGGAPPHETAQTIESSSNAGAAQAKVGATSTPTVADPEDHNATSTVKAGPDEDHGLPTATATAKPTEPASKVEDNDADEGVTNTVEADDADDSATPNHGSCVAYAASIVHALGLTGEQNGAFVSLVARDKTAVTAKVAEGGTADAACATAIVKAKVAAQAAGVTTTADDHGDNHDSGNHDSTQQHGNDNKTATTTPATAGEDKGSRH
jgi:hypothetical protein